jgi:hypothetical protein
MKVQTMHPIRWKWGQQSVLSKYILSFSYLFWIFFLLQFGTYIGGRDPGALEIAENEYKTGVQIKISLLFRPTSLSIIHLIEIHYLQYQ